MAQMSINAVSVKQWTLLHAETFLKPRNEVVKALRFEQPWPVHSGK